jgi:very-short-patch-repair endonuclease
MSNTLQPELRELADRQCGVLSRRQALSYGLSDDLIIDRVHDGRWQRLQRGVYAAFSGDVGRQAALWAAVLRAGPGAALSHRTAAELERLADGESALIHLTIPAARRVMPIRGAVVHTRVDAEVATHPSRLPPRLRLEETVFDLADTCDDVYDAIGWVTSALGRRLTSQDRLRATLYSRSRTRWRNDLSRLLSPDMAGIHSVLEYRYVRHVERPHGLPSSKRQAVAIVSTRRAYRDVLYEDYGLIVELDGQAAHPEDERWLDTSRDNSAAAAGLSTLRYGYRDVLHEPCLVAAQVADALQRRGWPESPRRCSARCPLPAPPERPERKNGEDIYRL